MKENSFFTLVGKIAGSIYLCYLLGAAPCLLTALSALEEAEKLLWEDQLKQALPLLEDALNADPKNAKIYEYLGIVYQELGDIKKAISIMQRGLDLATTTKHILYTNIGNSFYLLDEKIFAEEMYSNSIALNSTYALPYLNRANTRVKLVKYADAIRDYERFLILMPNTPKRPEIEAMITRLKRQIEEQDKKRAEELAKEKALMDEILNSLQNASEDTKNLSVESKVILDEKVGEVDIDE